MASNRTITFLLLASLTASLISCKPACPIAACQVRMVHPHGKQDYRGRPFWKKQNPKMGQKLDKVSQEKTPNRKDKSRNKQ